MTTDVQDIEQQKALDHIRELMSAHWREAEDADAPASLTVTASGLPRSALTM